MAQQSRLIISVFISIFCLLSESKIIQSNNDNNKIGSDAIKLFSQVFDTFSIPKIKSIDEINVPLVYNVIEEIRNSVPKSNNIDDLEVEVDLLDVKYFDEFYDYMTDEETQIKAALKKIDKELSERKRMKYDEMNKKKPDLSYSFQGCSKDPYPPPDPKIKRYQINLDAPPEDRWKEVIQQKIAQIRKLANIFEEVLGPEIISVLDTAMTWLHHLLPSEYYRELNGISTASGISIARVTLYNVFYELFTFCTSIVMEAEDGKIYHGRNLDFGIFLGWDTKNHTWLITEILRPLTVKIDFMKNDTLLYSAVTYAGYTGILTGIKKNTFSLTIDERFTWDGGYVGLAEWILGARDSSWLGLLTRKVMESAVSFDQAQQLLAHTPLVAPVYFILAGNTSHQGSIVTRGRRDADIWPLGSRHREQKGSWYLVQTNYDHWKNTPFYDQRRQYAVQCMDGTGRQKPMETLYRVLSTRPILNKETTLTAVMDVTEGLLEVWERDCSDPCWPF